MDLNLSSRGGGVGVKGVRKKGLSYSRGGFWVVVESWEKWTSAAVQLLDHDVDSSWRREEARVAAIEYLWIRVSVMEVLSSMISARVMVLVVLDGLSRAETV
jgi:hypothetical protein